MKFLLWWYAMDPRDGSWLYQHGTRRLAKGSGKSPNAAVIALLEFCGPVRLDRKDHRLPGGAKGKPVDMPLVQIVATSESQTANTMRMVRAFAPKGSPVVKECHLDPGRTRYNALPEGTLEVVTSSYSSAEGAESTFVVADETEHWLPANRGPILAATLEDNLAKSGSRMLETSNAWVPGVDSVAEATWDSWVAQEEGRVKDEAGRILYDARIAPPTTDMSDYESLTDALRWVYGDCEWKRDESGEIDIDPILKRIWSPRSDPNDSKRKYLNWPTEATDAWVKPEEWAALTSPREVDPEEPIVLFFDGSKSRDATAVVACCLSDGYVFVPEWPGGSQYRFTVWEPSASSDPDAEVSATNVDLSIDWVFENHNVVAFFGDVREWESFVKVEWPRRHGAKLRKVWADRSGRDPQRIAWDMRSKVMDFTRACELVNAEIVAGEFKHDGNPVLLRHVVNCRRRPNRWGISVGKATPDSPDKIDAGVCMIGARMVMRMAIAAGLGKPGSQKRKVVVLG